MQASKNCEPDTVITTVREEIKVSQKKRYKTLYYKNASIVGIQKTLGDMLKEALSESSNRKKASSRQESINDSGDMRFINSYENYNGMFFSQLVSIEAGKIQSYLHLDDESESYPIKPVNLDLVEGKDLKATEKLRREFLDSIIYFGVIGNHVAILQSSTLRSRQLESYLNWFLGTSCCNILPENTPIILNDSITDEMRERITQSPAKEISVGSPINTKPVLPVNFSSDAGTTTLTTNANVASVKHVLDQDDASLIKRFFGLNLTGKQFSDSLEKANLSLEMTLKFKNTTTKNGQQLIDQVATSLRHLDPEDYYIKLSDKSTIRGGELVVAGQITVQFTDSGAIDEAVLKNDMHKWLVKSANHSN